MGGIAATFTSDATCLWATGESLVHQRQVHGQRAQTVIPLAEVVAIELKEVQDRRPLLAAGGVLAAGLAGGLGVTPLILPVALVGVIGCLVASTLTRTMRLVVRAPTQTIKVQAAGKTADELTRFARRLEAIRLGRHVHRAAGAMDLDASDRTAGPRKLGQG